MCARTCVLCLSLRTHPFVHPKTCQRHGKVRIQIDKAARSVCTSFFTSSQALISSYLAYGSFGFAPDSKISHIINNFYQKIIRSYDIILADVHEQSYLLQLVNCRKSFRKRENVRLYFLKDKSYLTHHLKSDCHRWVCQLFICMSFTNHLLCVFTGYLGMCACALTDHQWMSV